MQRHCSQPTVESDGSPPVTTTHSMNTYDKTPVARKCSVVIVIADIMDNHQCAR